jgi:hypothetical protein
LNLSRPRIRCKRYTHAWVFERYDLQFHYPDVKSFEIVVSCKLFGEFKIK